MLAAKENVTPGDGALVLVVVELVTAGALLVAVLGGATPKEKEGVGCCLAGVFPRGGFNAIVGAGKENPEIGLGKGDAF